jgi:hypothetical protein
VEQVRRQAAERRPPVQWPGGSGHERTGAHRGESAVGERPGRKRGGGPDANRPRGDRVVHVDHGRGGDSGQDDAPAGPRHERSGDRGCDEGVLERIGVDPEARKQAGLREWRSTRHWAELASYTGSRSSDAE